MSHRHASDFTGDDHTLFSGLTLSQAAAVRANGYVLGLAGAGTGKTTTLARTVARRILQDGTSPSRIVVTTFTNEAARTMRARIAALVSEDATPNWIGTFHALALRQVREDPDIAGVQSGFSIIDPEDLASTASMLFTQTGIFGAKVPSKDFIKDFLGYISILKSNLIAPEDLEGESPPSIDPMDFGCMLHPLPTFDDPMMPEYVRRFYRPFQDYLRAINHLDFDDLLLWVTRRMLNDSEFRQRMSSRFDAIVVDEFQDVNKAQFHWAQCMASSSGQLFAVGDDGQAIFVWRGAHTAYIREFQSFFPGATVIPLTENFRSTGHILTVANAMLRQDRKAVPKELYTTAGDGFQVEVCGHHTERDEAQSVAARVHHLLSTGTPPSEIAIIYRSNRLGYAVDHALSGAGIPTTVIGGVSFYSRLEVRVALSLMALAEFGSTRQSDPYFERVCNVPLRGLGKSTVLRLKAAAYEGGGSLMSYCGDIVREARERTPPAKLPKGLEDFINIMDKVSAIPGDIPLHARMREAVRLLGYSGHLASIAGHDFTSAIEQGERDITREDAEDAAGRLENLEELYSQAMECADLRELLDRVTLQTRPDRKDSVKLMSVHSAKGLEFEYVFLVGMDNGLFPSPRSDVSEEARLAYVACSRAKRCMVVNWSKQRYGREAGPSRFIASFPAEATKHTGVANGMAEKAARRPVVDSDLMARILRRLNAFSSEDAPNIP